MQQNHPYPVTAADGALVGLLAGLIGGIVATPLIDPYRRDDGPVAAAVMERIDATQAGHAAADARHDREHPAAAG